VLKGGLALDFRLGNLARTTQDIDLAWLADSSDAEGTLQRAAQHDLGDHFVFQVERSHILDDADVGGAMRYNVACNLAGRQYAEFHLDIGVSPPVLLGEPDAASGLSLLSFAEIDPISLLVLPLAQHVAEKVHAYTRTYGPQNRPSSRDKDLVDLVLIQAHERLTSDDLRRALDTVFALRVVPQLPRRLPSPPSNWRTPYRRKAAALAIPADLDEGFRLADAFLTPVLDGTVSEGFVWEPGQGWSARP
jgi:hypothetical protein